MSTIRQTVGKLYGVVINANMLCKYTYVDSLTHWKHMLLFGGNILSGGVIFKCD